MFLVVNLMNELLKMQSNVLNAMKSDIKEIHALIKRVQKEVKRLGTPKDIKAVNETLKVLKKRLRPIEKQILVFRFKEATPESIAGIRELAQEVKKQKELLLESYQ